MMTANASCIDQVPVTISDVAQVTTCGDYSSQYRGWQAFDNDPNSMWISATWVSPAWIAYEFNYPKTIRRYSINYVNGQITTRAPKNWELRGSNDGTQWAVVDTRLNEVNWAGSERRSYAVNNPGSYRHYRLYVTDDNDDRFGVVVISMGDLTLESCGCDYASEQVPVLTGNSLAVSASGVYTSAYPAWNAFDGGSNSQGTMWISQVWQTPAWIGYEWTTPRFIEQYSITYSNGGIRTRAPKDWTLQGWDGVNWINLDSRLNQVNWGALETRSYIVGNPGGYIKYRLLVNDDNDSRTGVVVISIGGLSLRGCTL
jgi:hypothetical protein